MCRWRSGQRFPALRCAPEGENDPNLLCTQEACSETYSSRKTSGLARQLIETIQSQRLPAGI
jgi:hypothetical protein